MAKRTFQTNIGGDSLEKKVGVGGITDVNWFNIQYPFNGPFSTTSPENIWDMGQLTTGDGASFVNLGAQEYITNNGTDYDYLLQDFGATGNALRFTTTKMVVAQCTILTSAPNVNEGLGGLGFCVFGGNNAVVDQGIFTDPVIAFVRKDSNGQWYTHVSDGSAMTETAITLANSTSYVLRIEYDPGNATPQARFYVDGVLIHPPVTTNLPTADTNPIGWACGNGAGANDNAIQAISCPSFAIEQ